jgi:hypothetical protein
VPGLPCAAPSLALIRGCGAGLEDLDGTPSKSMGNCMSSCGAWAGPSRGEGPGNVLAVILGMSAAGVMLAAVDLCRLRLLPASACISPTCL